MEPTRHLGMPQTSQDMMQVLKSRLIWHPHKSSVTPALQGQFPSHAPAGQDPHMPSQGSGWLGDTCHLGVFGQCICRLMLPEGYWPVSRQPDQRRGLQGYLSLVHLPPWLAAGCLDLNPCSSR